MRIEEQVEKMDLEKVRGLRSRGDW